MENAKHIHFHKLENDSIHICHTYFMLFTICCW